ICVYFFSSRSSAAWAKKALADFRISLARRSSRFSFSSALRRSRSSVVTPDRIPRSTSDRLIQASRVVGVQPIFGAIDSIAAHSDRYSSRCSCTRRTARSRTSGENLLFLLMAPFSQEMKPPQNPGRFTLSVEEAKKLGAEYLNVPLGHLLSNAQDESVAKTVAISQKEVESSQSPDELLEQAWNKIRDTT